MLNQASGAHGNEARNTSGVKKLPNPANFKIVKCKNFEKGKYLSHLRLHNIHLSYLVRKTFYIY